MRRNTLTCSIEPSQRDDAAVRAEAARLASSTELGLPRMSELAGFEGSPNPLG